MVETVRLWLQEGLNSHKFQRIVFCARANLPLLEEALENYFPLLPFTHSVSPRLGGGEAPASDEEEDVDEETPKTPAEVDEVAPADCKENNMDEEVPANHKEEDIDEEAPAHYKENAIDKESTASYQENGMDKEATGNKEKEEVPADYEANDVDKKAPASHKEGEADRDDKAETPVIKDSVHDTFMNSTNKEPVVPARSSLDSLHAAAEGIEIPEVAYPTVIPAPRSKQSGDIDLGDITLELDELERQAKQKLIELTQASPTPPMDPLHEGSEDAGYLPEGELDPLEQVVRDLMAQANQQVPSSDQPVSAGDRKSSSVLNPERTESDV